MTQTTTWDIVVVGSANSDYLIRGPKLPLPGETIQGETFLAAPGGKGANQAVAAARLGARVAFVARIGKDERGQALMANLQAQGVDTSYVVQDEQAATGVALIMVGQGGEKQILTAPGANHQLAVVDVEAAQAAIASTKVVLAQLEAPLEVVQAAFRLGREAGARTVLDPAPAVPLANELLQEVDLIRPNSSEAEVITGVKVTDPDSARQAAGILLQRGVGAVAMQAGDAGNLLIWPEGECWLPKVPVQSIDATGAGDAFAAAIAVALAENQPWSEAGRFANAAAAIATTGFGAQTALPTRSAIMSLLATT
ncbi:MULTISPECIES: ribokinase [Trichocoleus]|uniref:Ribokinase n=1 Tax=Trichocoleus desertorum GB2-A4 TaxID=2933944 RepID=A0ABV0J8D1_9CYAN|nr:ribokinase [Trichocoleus sp. FACHB-46]MBD1861047.1 ribokinase [Trichocoleus sp. FACHB-46]